MSRSARRRATPYLLTAALAAGILATPCAGQERPETPAPLFAEVWVGGPLDSIYNAEYARLNEVCGSDDACFRQRLDTTAVRLAPVWFGPTDSEPRGWLAARLATDGRWPRGVLLYRTDGLEVILRQDLGDWGYGITLPLADTTSDRLSPIFPQLSGSVWLPRTGARGWGVLAVFGLEGRLWRLESIRGRRPSGGENVELSPGVYRALEVGGGHVVLRPEIPSDMPCGEIEGPDPEAPPAYEVPLERLIGPEGIPRVEIAYPKGC